MSLVCRVVFRGHWWALLALSLQVFRASIVAAATGGVPAVRFCPGDCDGSSDVTVEELIRGIDVALGTVPATVCTAMDVNGDGRVTIDELLAAVNAALTGCPTPPATATGTSTPMPSPSATATVSPTATASPTASETRTATRTMTTTSTFTPTLTATATASPTPTATSSATPTSTATGTPSQTHTPSFTPSRTPTPASTPTSTSTPPSTPTGTPTGTPPPSVTVVPEGLSIRIGVGSAVPGGSATVEVTLRTGGETVVATENRILLDARAPIAARGSRPDCQVNPAIEKDSSIFVFLPPGCTTAGGCEAAKAIVISFSNSAAIPDGSVLYSCTVQVSAAAVPGDRVPLLCSEPVASGPAGELLEPVCIAGEIAVAAPEATPGG